MKEQLTVEQMDVIKITSERVLKRTLDLLIDVATINGQVDITVCGQILQTDEFNSILKDIVKEETERTERLLKIKEYGVEKHE